MGDYWFAAALYWLLHRVALAQRFGITSRGPVQAAHGLLALGLVAVVVTATWLPGRLEFSRLCAELAEPRIHARMKVEGFYLDDLTANSFGTRYLHDEGFARAC